MMLLKLTLKRLRKFFLLICLILACTFVLSNTVSHCNEENTIYILKDNTYERNYFYPWSLGDFEDISFFPYMTYEDKVRRDCMKVVYSAEGKPSGVGWASISFTYPSENYGKKKGCSIVGAEKLVFFAKGQKGGEIIEEILIGGVVGRYRDSDYLSFGPIVLTKNWDTHEIDVSNLDLSNVITGIRFVLSKKDNPKGAILFLDEIKYTGNELAVKRAKPRKKIKEKHFVGIGQ